MKQTAKGINIQSTTLEPIPATGRYCNEFRWLTEMEFGILKIKINTLKFFELPRISILFWEQDWRNQGYIFKEMLNIPHQSMRRE